MPPSAFDNTTALLSFEKDLGGPQMGTFAATGEFKACADSPAVDGPTSRTFFFGGKVDERDLFIIDSDN